MAGNSKMKLPLFDDYWIDFRCSTVRRWFRPEYYSLAPMGYYASLFYDPFVGKYRNYYEILMDKTHRVLKLAESDDLRSFTPVLKNGSDIIWDGISGIHGATIMLDIRETNPECRYKFCGMVDTDRFRETSERDAWLGVEIAMSADGLNWNRHPELVASPQTSDALNKLVYNPLTDVFSMLHRSAFADRRISVRKSRDLIHWSEPRVILQPGPNYNDEHTAMQHYSMTAGYFGGIFYGLVWRYNTGLSNLDFSRIYGYMEPELVYSYDGEEYLYTSGNPLMDRPLPPQPGCAGLSPLDMLESRDGKNYFILCSGALFEHGAWNTGECREKMAQKGTLIEGNPIYCIRKDGFCGIESIGTGGLVITKGLCLDAPDLEYNLRANCGYARFGIMDIEGNYLAGFGLDDCIPFEFDDDVAHRPCWKDHSLSQLLGRQIRLVIELNNAILHCITATARPFIRQMQMSFSNPQGIPLGSMQDEKYHFPGQFNR